MNHDFFLNEEADRFEQMLLSKEQWYYDVEDIVNIITYYVDISDAKYAYAALCHAQRLHPTNLEIQIKEVEVCILQRKYSKAQILIDNLSRLHFNHLDLLIAQAKLFSIKKDYRNAIEYYKLALENGDEEEFILSSIGNEYLNMNDIETALEYFLRTLKINPEDEYAFYSALHCLQTSKNTSATLDFLNDYVNQNPYADFAWYNLGLEYHKNKQYQDALHALDYALVINEHFLSAYWQKATVLEKMKKFSEAIAVYIESFEYDDTPAYSYLKIGNCYKRSHDFPKALAAFYNAIYHDPQLDKPWAEAAYIHEKMQNLGEALFYIRRALELNSSSIVYLKKKISYCLQLTLFDEALSTYDQLLLEKPKHRDNLISEKAGLLLRLADYPSVIALLEPIAENSSDEKKLYYLAFAYLLISQLKEGMHWFNQAYTKSPGTLDTYRKSFPQIFSLVPIKNFLSSHI